MKIFSAKSLLVVMVFGMAQSAIAAPVVTGRSVSDSVAPTALLDRLHALSVTTVLNAACCKVCSKGKACGNSCINRSYTCHQPPGCAC